MLQKIRNLANKNLELSKINLEGSKKIGINKIFDWLSKSDYIGIITPSDAIKLEEAKSKASSDIKELHQHIHYHQR